MIVKLTKRASIYKHKIFDGLEPSKDKDVGTARALDLLQIEEVDHRGLCKLKLLKEEMFIKDSFQHTV